MIFNPFIHSSYLTIIVYKSPWWTSQLNNKNDKVEWKNWIKGTLTIRIGSASKQKQFSWKFTNGLEIFFYFQQFEIDMKKKKEFFICQFMSRAKWIKSVQYKMKSISWANKISFSFDLILIETRE